MLTKAIDDIAGQITKANVAIKTCQRYCNLMDTAVSLQNTFLATLLICVLYLFCFVLFFLQTRNTKKAEDNVSSLEKEIEENSANLQRLDVSNDSINDCVLSSGTVLYKHKHVIFKSITLEHHTALIHVSNLFCWLFS